MDGGSLPRHMISGLQRMRRGVGYKKGQREKIPEEGGGDGKEIPAHANTGHHEGSSNLPLGIRAAA